MICVENMMMNCGQELYLLDQASLSELRKQTVFADAEITGQMLDFAEKQVAFSEKHNGFTCGIVKIKYVGHRVIWVPLLFYRIDDELVRVAVNNAKCQVCDWHGLAADPTVPYLYESLHDRFAQMKCAANQKTVPCPKCGSKLDHHGMHAVWIWSADLE